MGVFNPCVFNEDVFNTGGSCEAECTHIITEDVRDILTENGLFLVTEDSDCEEPPGGAIFDNIVRIGFPFEPISGMVSIGSSTTIGG